MICPVCNEEITDGKSIIAIDRPVRLNILFHKECLIGLDVKTFITENFDRIVDLYKENPKIPHKKG